MGSHNGSGVDPGRDGREPSEAPLTPSRHWHPAFDSLLQTVRASGTHGQLVDVRDVLRPVLGPTRPLVMLCPHADDGAITASCLLHEFAVRRGLPVIEVLVFTGERNVAAPWLNAQKRVSVREQEFRLECNVLGAEAVCWELDAYRNIGYQPTPADVDKIVEWFRARTPGAVIVPPSTDAHLAHRMTRALAALGLVGAGLKDTLVLTGWTPWGPLPRPNAYLPYDAEAERTKDWAINCHASQVLLTDYTEFCSHLGRAYAALAREWTEGHNLANGPRSSSQKDNRLVGVELFQVETFDPTAISAVGATSDPIQFALGVLAGKLTCPAPAPNPVTETPVALASNPL